MSAYTFTQNAAINKITCIVKSIVNRLL